MLRGTLKSSRFRFSSYNFFLFCSRFSRSINYSMMDVAFLFENITFSHSFSCIHTVYYTIILSYYNILFFNRLIFLFLTFISLINKYNSRSRSIEFNFSSESNFRPLILTFNYRYRSNKCIIKDTNLTCSKVQSFSVHRSTYKLEFKHVMLASIDFELVVFEFFVLCVLILNLILNYR